MLKGGNNMANLNEVKTEVKNNDSELNVSFEHSEFNGELKYKITTSDRLIREIGKTFSAMTNDYLGARFVCVDRVPQIAIEFLNARMNDIDRFINAKASNEEKASLFQISNIIRNYINAEENSKLKHNGALSYVALYFGDIKEGDGKVKFVKSKDQLAKESSEDKIESWINAWNSRNDYKYLSITPEAKKCLEGFVPRKNPINNKDVFGNHGIIWENLYDVKSIDDLYNRGYNKQYNVVEVPIDIRKFFSMIHGRKIKGSNQIYQYDFNLIIPNDQSLFAEQIRTNNFMLNVVQVDGEQVQKTANESGIATNNNKLGFIGYSN